MVDGLISGLSLRGVANDRRIERPEKLAESTKENREDPDNFENVLSQKSVSTQAPRSEKQAASKIEAGGGPRRTKPEEETPSAKEKFFGKVEETKPKKTVSTKEQAMLEFMDSMESEFGIPPERILEAMAMLPKEKLLQTPEETSEQVIEALDLPPGQAEMALSMYNNMLQKIEPQSAVTSQTQAAVSIPVMTATERRAKLNDSLDRLSQKFFMRSEVGGDMATSRLMGETARPNELLASDKAAMGGSSAGETGKTAPGKIPFATGSELLPGDLSTPVVQESDGLYSRSAPAKSAAFAGGQQQPSALSAGLDLAQSNQNQQTALQGSTAELMAKLTALGAAASELGQVAPQVKPESVGPSSKLLNDSNSSFAMGGTTAALAGLQLGGMGSAQSELSDESDGKEGASGKGLETDPRGLEGLASHKADGLGFKEVLGSTAVGSTVRGSEIADPNIEKIMNQAQMVVRKGGGEATIKMNPEGLGEVHLKIMVKEGKVNVEMATETKEAKKLIENHLSDLKASLGDQKLTMESVKIESTLKSSSDHSQNHKNPDFNQDQGRDNARQMFQQFREDNLNRREPFMEMPGIRAYAKSPSGPKPLQPVPEETRTRSLRADGRGERMNLVA